MRSLWTRILLAESGTAQVYDYELDALREIADVQILNTENVDKGGATVRRYTVHFVLRHPAVRPCLTPRAPAQREDGRAPASMLPRQRGSGPTHRGAG
jgi:hypothetical protein